MITKTRKGGKKNEQKQTKAVYIYICIIQHHYAYSYKYSTRDFNNFCAMHLFESLVKPTDPFSEKKRI